ncbi:MAG: YlxR family protein [Desulfobacteraceae bacterium]|nr:YlxR family protein [Desulfobacteraceae bacterium]
MASRKRHIPERTCIGCGAKQSKNELIRLVVDSGGLVVRDDWGKGRGAYVCPNNSCWKGLEKEHILRKAFGREGPIALHSELQGITWGNGNNEIEKRLF